MLKQTTQRSTVTVEDRRHVLLASRARKPFDVAAVAHEAFIRNALKDRLGWPRREPAPASVLKAVRELAAVLRVPA